MKKLTIDKEEGIGEVIERVTGSESDEVTIVIPKGSTLARSATNFRLLKAEADNAGKTVAIESVDDNILNFAKENDIEASHPLWRGVRGAGGVSDIIPAGDEVVNEMESEKPAPKRRTKKAAAKPVKPTKLVVQEEEEVEVNQESTYVGSAAEELEEFKEEESRFFSRKSKPEAEVSDEDEDMMGEDDSHAGRRRPRKLLWGGVIGVALVIIILWFITASFGHATVAIDFHKTAWTKNDAYAADKSVAVANASTNVIPAQVFTAQKNATQLFPASGSANVSIKAQGTITIYNAYSSAAQDLVATTRFVTPDGKLFRLVSSVTVPGAKVTDGQIVPSSITANVIADQAGPSYNVGAVPKLAIPGFKGTPKYDAFYGALLNGTTGGFTGTRAVPTAADITNAKSKMTSMLQSQLATNLTTSYPNNFEILDGATNIAVTKLTVNSTTDANGNFSVFGEATLTAIGFDENGFKQFLLGIASKDNGPANPTWHALDVSYSNVKADFTRGRVSFNANASGTLEESFDADGFKADIAGKSVSDARAMIARVAGLENGNLSVWPRWLWTIPGNTDKIEVTTD